jgi:hypothetical protein
MHVPERLTQQIEDLQSRAGTLTKYELWLLEDALQGANCMRAGTELPTFEQRMKRYEEVTGRPWKETV